MKAFTAVLFVLLAVAVVRATNEAGTRFLEENAARDGVVTLPSGLQYKVLREGEGAFHPGPASPCECHYRGTLIDGTEFDSSYKRGSPTTFAPNQVIKGWTEAMQLMVEGDKWELYIPSDLAYGDRGSPPKIGGGDALIFTIEILKIKGEKRPAIRCDPETKEKCSEKELAFIEKMAPVSADDKQKELQRLEKQQGRKMKPELSTWIAKRVSILRKLVANQGGKAEL
mmetsp:Transcript_45741/g.115125  ORF Transcript_45741/g.115125 Transcript_45741/m.115125 type:complete len:227 (-) Transcript_45741:146-826(-)